MVPILVRLSPDEDSRPQPGRTYTISGEVLRMTDQVAAEWGDAGEFRGEGEEMQATFTDYYLDQATLEP